MGKDKVAETESGPLYFVLALSSILCPWYFAS
jgi:hypothetical protein